MFSNKKVKYIYSFSDIIILIHAFQFNISHPVIQFCFLHHFCSLFDSSDFRVQNYKKNNKAYMFKQKKQEHTVKNYNLLKINVIKYFNITILFDN